MTYEIGDFNQYPTANSIAIGGILQDIHAHSRILVAPLNWGLGHATRCMPIIRALIREGFEPVLAGDGESLQLLRKEFPSLESHELPAYRIRYPKTGRWLQVKLAATLPRILRVSAEEHRRVESMVSSLGLSGIISDNRFGAWSNRVPSVYVTHQLRVRSGPATPIATRLHQIVISRFNACWVPDLEGRDSLAGELSDAGRNNAGIHYLGPQSRFRSGSGTKDIGITALLSGPEPQRGLLENSLLKELQRFEGEAFLIRGVVGKERKEARTGNLTLVNFLLQEELEELLNRSELVVARSGYSTIMDLWALGAKPFFIPTPGQPEQEYLAERMREKGVAAYCRQKDLSLDRILQGRQFPGFANKKTPKTPLDTRIFDVFRKGKGLY